MQRIPIFQTVFLESPIGMVVLNSDLSIRLGNKAFFSLCKGDPTEIAGRKFTSFIHEKHVPPLKKRFDALSLNPHKAFEADLLSNILDNYRMTPGSWWRVNFTSVKEQSTSYYVGFIQDVSQQKKNERILKAEKEISHSAMKAAEKAAKMKSDFLSTMSHEIRTPIHTIIGMGELLAETPLDEEQSEYASQISFAADVLLELINNILDFSKIEAGKLHLESISFDVHQTLETAVELVALEAHKKSLEVGVFLHPGVPKTAIGDPVRLRQIVVNLFNNAVKFTEKGSIILECIPVYSPDKSPELNSLIIKVRDTGIGIPSDKLDSLFKEFTQVDSSTTRKFGGTGLGLSISKSLSEMMGGSINVESEEGRGSTFMVHIHLSQEPKLSSIHKTLLNEYLKKQTDSKTNPTSNHNPGKILQATSFQSNLPVLYNPQDYSIIKILQNLSTTQPPQEWFLFSGWSSVPKNLTQSTILIVEDNQELRYLVEQYCLEWGFQVDSVGSGEEALSLLRSNAKSGKPYEIGLIDLTLPRMDGWQLASEINSDESINEVKLILMSPRGTGTMEAKMKLLHWFEAYLGKPIKKAELYSAIIDCLTVEGELEILEEIPDPTSNLNTHQNLGSVNNNQQPPTTSEKNRDSDTDKTRGTELEQLQRDPSVLHSSPDNPNSFRGIKILVAEDHEVNRTLFETILKSMSVEVTAVENGALAVEAAGKSEFDLIFMDVHMPVLNGYEATKQIRDRAVTVPIIAATANAIKGEQEKCLAVGMNGFLSKPFRKKDVVASLQQWLPQSTSSKSNLSVQSPTAQPFSSKLSEVKPSSGLLHHMMKKPNSVLDPIIVNPKATPKVILENSIQPSIPDELELLTNIGDLTIDMTEYQEIHEEPRQKSQNEGQSTENLTENSVSDGSRFITDPFEIADYKNLAIFDSDELMDTFMNQRETVKKVLNGYVDRAKAQILAIRKAIADGDADQLQQEAHGLKGASLSISAEMLGALTRDLESAGMDGNLDLAKKLVPLLPRTFRILEQRINQFLLDN
jgi:signal transduction histidine kinase/DNA-binding response OmpR family regulator/HPt (histidine-containing phosphotransfer) domain-containing protein